MTGLNQKYLTKWNYVNDPLVFAVSQKAWKSWSPEDQKIVREAAIEAARAEIADARKGVTGSDDALLKEAAAAGARVTVLTPGEQQAFARATQPVIEKWTPVIGADLVRKAQQAVAASRQ